MTLSVAFESSVETISGTKTHKIAILRHFNNPGMGEIMGKS
jgi:hypothetical protein